MTPVQHFDALADGLAGVPIGDVWRGHGSAIFIEIGSLTSYVKRDGAAGQPQGDVTLGLASNWRIQDDRSILCGSGSAEDLWAPAIARLRGASIRECGLFGTLPEIRLATRMGDSVLSFTATDGQP